MPILKKTAYDKQSFFFGIYHYMFWKFLTFLSVRCILFCGKLSRRQSMSLKIYFDKMRPAGHLIQKVSGEMQVFCILKFCLVPEGVMIFILEEEI